MSSRRTKQHELADKAVNAFEGVAIQVGWVWNPTRSGGDYGIDGFLTLSEKGSILPIDLAVQIKAVKLMKRQDGYGIGYNVSADSVNILRTHILGGYFILFDDKSKEMFFVNAEDIWKSFKTSN